MKRPTLKDLSGDKESSIDDKISTAIDTALSSNDKVIEIRPAKQSKGMGLKKLLLLGAGAVGLAYWVQKSQKPKELIESAKEKTANQTDKVTETIEEKTSGRTDQVAETIEEKSETASERIEDKSERAGKAVQEAGETAADKTEEAGEKAAKKTDDDDDDSSSSSSSSSSFSSA